MRNLFILIFLVQCVLVNAQNIVGKVFDKNREPIPGVTIQNETRGGGTITDLDGNFSIKAKKGDMLSFTFIGLKSKTVKINKNDKLSVIMEDDNFELNEVVVIGYGTSRKSDLTGAVASISEKQLSERVYVSPEQMLQGLVPGVQISEVTSEPGGESSIRIRGNNSVNSNNEPLFVIDGFIGGSIDGINSEDIASMEVLKDASATAIYGSRGANGVILITTKKGAVGKTTVDFNMKVGFSKTSKRIDMMDAQEYAHFLNEGASEPIFSEEQINNMRNTDWQDAIFQTGTYQNYQLSIRGGSKSLKYYVSGGYLSQKGNVINSNLDKMNLRANLQNRIYDKINIDINANFSSSKGNKATVNTAGNAQDGATVLNALRMSPFVPVYDENGNYTPYNTFEGIDESNPAIRRIGNPVAYANEVKNNMSNMNGSINTQVYFDIIKNLQWKSTFGTNFVNQENSKYVPKSTYEGSIVGAAGGNSTIKRSSFLTEHTLFYKFNHKRIHFLDLLAGFTYQSFSNSTFNISGQDYFSDSTAGENISDASVLTAYNSSFYSSSIMSYLGRINYRFRDRYIFTTSFRADGSSKFAKGHQWGYFPSAAMAWNINNENFMKSISWISQLKLRLSAGITGNQDITNFSSIFYYNTGQYPMTDGNKVVSLVPANIGNRKLEWEKTTSYNIGLDFSVFANRLAMVVDVYYKKTTDMLMEKKIPTSNGFRTAMDNIGDVENKGIELSLVSRNLLPNRNNGFFWETQYNFSLNRNKLIKLGNNNEDLYVGQSTGNMSTIGTTSILRVGEPIGSFFGCVYEGVWKDQEEINQAITDGRLVEGTPFRPGDPKFVDQNGDGAINQDDRVIVGSSYPKFTMGLNNTLSYKGIGLSFLLYGSYGNDVFNINRYYLEGWAQYNKAKYMKDRWTENNHEGKYPRQSSTIMRQTPGAASCYVEDASFIRIKNITLSYQIPTKYLSKTKYITNAKIYVTADNLYTFTNYSGYDPEVNSFGKSNLSLATDLGSYPKYRTFILGVQVKF